MFNICRLLGRARYHHESTWCTCTKPAVLASWKKCRPDASASSFHAAVCGYLPMAREIVRPQTDQPRRQSAAVSLSEIKDLCFVAPRLRSANAGILVQSRYFITKSEQPPASARSPPRALPPDSWLSHTGAIGYRIKPCQQFHVETPHARTYCRWARSSDGEPGAGRHAAHAIGFSLPKLRCCRRPRRQPRDGINATKSIRCVGRTNPNMMRIPRDFRRRHKSNGYRRFQQLCYYGFPGWRRERRRLAGSTHAQPSLHSNIDAGALQVNTVARCYARIITSLAA